MIQTGYSLFVNGTFTAGTLPGLNAGGADFTVCRKEWPEFQAAYWRLTVRCGAQDSALLSDVMDCDVFLPLPEDESGRMPGYMPNHSKNARLFSMNGPVTNADYAFSPERSAEEFALRETLFAACPEQEYASVGGLSSSGLMPFFDVNLGSHGYLIAIGWTGGWRARFARAEGGVRVQTGLSKTAFRLRPGEEVSLSSVLIMEYHDGQTEARNRFRRLIRHAFSPAGRREIMAFEHWGGLTTDEIVRRLNLLRDHGVQFDYHWIDAGWYGLSTPACDSPYVPGWSQNTGDWRISPQCHPGGMAEIVEAEKQCGMRMMLWVEPERCVAKTPDCQTHPEWFLEWPDPNKDNPDRSLLMNLGCDEARAHCFETLCSLIDRLEIGCYRQDFNCNPAAAWAAADEPDRIGMHEILHINGLYRLWDALLEKYPHLVIDNCAGGGRRIDLETLSRSVPFFRSDYQCGFNTEPEVTQAHNSGISLYLPYNGCTTKTKGDIYAIRSTYSSSWGGAFWCTKFLDMTGSELDWAAAVSREYRMLQPYFSADFYCHGTAGLDPTAWCVWQYNRPEEKDGMVIAFRRKRSPNPSAAPELCGLQKGLSYRFTDIDSGESFLLGADEIESGGLTITIGQKRASRILLYKAAETE